MRSAGWLHRASTESGNGLYPTPCVLRSIVDRTFRPDRDRGANVIRISSLRRCHGRFAAQQPSPGLLLFAEIGHRARHHFGACVHDAIHAQLVEEVGTHQEGHARHRDQRKPREPILLGPFRIGLEGRPTSHRSLNQRCTSSRAACTNASFMMARRSALGTWPRHGCIIMRSCNSTPIVMWSSSINRTSFPERSFPMMHKSH